MGDVRVERFDVNVSTDGSTHSLINTLPNLDKAFVFIKNSSDYASGGPVGNVVNGNPNDTHCGISITANNRLTFHKSNSTTLKHRGEVWRYRGAPGGANEFISRGRVSLTISSGSSSASVAISGIVSRNKCIPFHNGLSTTLSSTTDYEGASIGVHLNASDEVVVSRNNTAGDVTVYVDVVEFVGANWSIGHGRSTGHENGNTTVTLNTDSMGTGGSTFDTGDWATAFIVATMEGDTSETGLADNLAVVYPAAGTTQVIFSVRDGDNNARNDGTSYIQVAQNDGLNVTRGVNTNVSEGNNTYGTPLPLPLGVDTSGLQSEYALEWFTSTTGTGTAHARGRLAAAIEEAGAVGTTDYSFGASIDSSEYNSSLDYTVDVVLTFGATPSGLIYEAGGTGTGTAIGHNTSGDFIARSGNGGSVEPDDCARCVITPAEYDFAGRTGRLFVQFDLSASTMSVSFDNGNTGTFDYTKETTAISGVSNWSGGDTGGVGTGNGSIAGSEFSLAFSGSFTELSFRNTLIAESGGASLAITHWVHRSGNNILARYGVINLTGLLAVAPPLGNIGVAKRWDGFAFNVAKIRGWTGSGFTLVKLGEGTEFVIQEE